MSPHALNICSHVSRWLFKPLGSGWKVFNWHPPLRSGIRKVLHIPTIPSPSARLSYSLAAATYKHQLNRVDLLSKSLVLEKGPFVVSIRCVPFFAIRTPLLAQQLQRNRFSEHQPSTCPRSAASCADLNINLPRQMSQSSPPLLWRNVQPTPIVAPISSV